MWEKKTQFLCAMCGNCREHKKELYMGKFIFQRIQSTQNGWFFHKSGNPFRLPFEHSIQPPRLSTVAAWSSSIFIRISNYVKESHFPIHFGTQQEIRMRSCSLWSMSNEYHQLFLLVFHHLYSLILQKEIASFFGTRQIVGSQQSLQWH